MGKEMRRARGRYNGRACDRREPSSANAVRGSRFVVRGSSMLTDRGH
jgi:hypothetical protein